MQIDWDKLFTAAVTYADPADGPQDRGFLNRVTGEVVFLYPSVGEAEAWHGMCAATDMVFDQARVDANPDEWVEIPRIDGRRLSDDEAEAFVRDFLRQHGTNADTSSRIFFTHSRLDSLRTGRILLVCNRCVGFYTLAGQEGVTMAESQGVVRTNISLPRDLKARMDAVKEAVNWSAVAAEAFKAKLLEVESRKEVAGMDDVIARLKAAQELESSEDYREGREAGEEWAKQHARPKLLRKLDELDGYDGKRIDWWLDVYDNGMNEGIAWGLYKAMHGGLQGREEWDRSEIEGFWEETLGPGWADRIGGWDFALGFVEGALHVWGQVRDKL